MTRKIFSISVLSTLSGAAYDFSAVRGSAERGLKQNGECFALNRVSFFYIIIIIILIDELKIRLNISSHSIFKYDMRLIE